MAEQPLLQACRVHKTYHFGAHGVEVLRGVDLAVHSGEWLAVLGSSGSGKSTLMHLLGGLDRPDAGKGEIRFRGDPISLQPGAALDAYRNRDIGFVFQFYHLLPELSVLENTLLPAFVHSARKQGRAALRRDAEALLGAFGLDHRLSHRPSQLSGGERQRVAIARALINRPAVLLADEPTGNLDAATGAGILDLLAERHRQGLTVVMVTHDREVAARATRQIRLVNGLSNLVEEN